MGLIGVTGGLLLVPWVNRGEESQLAGVVLSTGLGSLLDPVLNTQSRARL